MSTQYLLPCTCGRSITVSPRQAGQEVTCECGAAVDVPTMRQLRQLELAEATKSADQPRWSTTQGILFAGGTLLAMVAAGLAMYCLVIVQFFLDTTTPQVNYALLKQSIDQLTPEESLLLWERLRAPPPEIRPPFPHLIHRELAKNLKKKMVLSLAATVVGIGIAVSAFLIQSKKR